MDTIRVNICYRPLRIGWAIRSGDMEAFRQAVRLSYTLWGGRHNPIFVFDREEEAKRLADLFRIDMIWPLGETDEAKAFPKRFPYLIRPFFHDTLFVGDEKSKQAQVLDVHNALVHLHDKPEWKAIEGAGVRLYTWQADDPLADAFLIQLGAYPSAEETGLDYRGLLTQVAGATEHILDPAAVIPADTLDHPSIPYLSGYGLDRHYTIDAGRDTPGFFVGDAGNVDDLLCHWNLQAAGIPLWFVDPSHLDRYADIIPKWESVVRKTVAHRHEWKRSIAVWSRREDFDQACKPFDDMQVMRCHVSDALWNGRNVRAPMMHLGEVSVLGVVGRESGRPKVSFALTEKPYCGDVWFHQQRLVASISFIGGLFGDEQHTLIPPYLPELNEFYARSMYFRYDELRIEPGRVGLVIDAADHDSYLYALPIADLMERIFGMAGYTSKLSAAGLIARQILAQLGGLQGARVFKIPGVRRLLKTHGPNAAFTKRSAIQLIAKNPENSEEKFSDYHDLHIEQRPIGTKLQPNTVFAHLVEKSLFRIGAELTCPVCRMASWTALDALKQRVVCDMCGNEYEATRQLVDSEWHFRRSGVLGSKKNALGAVPVALTLQQLDTSLGGGWSEGIYSPSLELTPKDGSDLPPCEIDLVWVIPRPYPRKTVVILGECKDQWAINTNDIDKLRRVADALPRKRFKTFVLLSKLCPFTPEEIESARTLNNEYRSRAILLTARELEPYFIYERTKAEFDIKGYGSTPEELAQATVEMYFQEQSVEAGETELDPTC